ncbi:MAG: RnfABCDGE type electron transport complex subunit G [Acidobacteria bacterium]|nr:RnfABCDGE type electron transport complex subunit G [Acidobacteriota bacterium]
MKDLLRLILVLTIICAVSAGLLALVESLTADARAQAKRAEMLRAIQSVMPIGYANEPDRSIVSVNDAAGNPHKIFVGLKADGQVTGFAFQSADPKGYGGEIQLMIGLTADGVITGIEILQHKETPGLGTKIQDPEFRQAFEGKTLDNSAWKVQKEGGSFPQFAGATISPRAVVNAVQRGLEFYRSAQDQIRAKAAALSTAGDSTAADSEPAAVPTGPAGEE